MLVNTPVTSHNYIFFPVVRTLSSVLICPYLSLTFLQEVCLHLCILYPQEGKRSVCGEHTIFYMLHCGTALYNNLLWSNWSVDALSKMIIIGNSFKGLEER